MNERAEKLRGKILLLEELLENLAHKDIDGMLSEQVNLRRQQILLTPLSSSDRIYQQEFAKGEAAGIELARGLPTVYLETLKQDYEKELHDGNREPTDD